MTYELESSSGSEGIQQTIQKNEGLVVARRPMIQQELGGNFVGEKMMLKY